ncbi:MAG: LamG domain-containing protein [Candidatus Omnitrophica bacterium]|nr:LamG domain-containing protein [Candidatus Omnitrophota bacterium]
MEKKTKLILIVIVFFVLAALWLQSTNWFRLQLAEHYKNIGQKRKVVQIYEKVLRKDEVEVDNLLVFKGKLDKRIKYDFAKKAADYNYKKGNKDKAIDYYKILQELKPEKEKDYFCLYYLIKQEEKLADFILFNSNLKNKIPGTHFSTPLWRFYLAKSLAKKEQWGESETILKELVKKYPYLNTFKNSIEDIKNERVLEQDFPIIGMWNFDEGKGDIAEDSSGMRNNGQIKGARWVKELDGYALSFDGKDDTVTFTGDESLDLDRKDFTIAMWLKPQPQKKYRFVYYKWRPNLYLYKDDKTWSFELQDGQRNKPLKIRHLVKNKWYFIVQRVKQNKEYKVWLFDREGLIKAASREDIGISNGSDKKRFTLSRRGWHPENNACFEGCIGKVYVFKEAVSDKEIEKLYDFSKGKK